MVPIIVSIVIPLLLYFLNKASKREANISDTGSFELRMNFMYQIIGIAGFLMSLIFLLMPVLADEYSAEIFVVSGFMFLLSLGVSVPVFLWYKNHHVSFDEMGLTSTNAYGKKQYIPWNNIRQIKFSAFMGVLQVFDKQGNVAKAHQHLVGFSSFVQALQAHEKKYHFACGELPIKMWGVNNKKDSAQIA